MLERLRKLWTVYTHEFVQEQLILYGYILQIKTLLTILSYYYIQY